MDLIGLVDRIHAAAAYIDAGRKGFATRGKAEEGRISYEKGIAEAKSAFKEASATNVAATTADPQTVILVDYTFLTQEKEFCAKSDYDTFNSLTIAIQLFDDAFRVLKTVENSAMYKIIETAFPHHKNYRTREGYPKDAFHVACESHKARLKNILRSPGIDLIEKDLLKQRIENLSTAQKSYKEKQKKVLSI